MKLTERLQESDRRVVTVPETFHQNNEPAVDAQQDTGTAANPAGRVAAWLIVIAVVTGCEQHSSCEAQAETGNHEAALAACRAEYLRDNTGEALRAWVAAAGELGRHSEIEAAMSAAAASLQLGDGLVEAARAAERNGNPDSARDYYSAAADAYRTTGADERLASALHRQHLLAWRRSDHRGALQYATEAQSAARRAGSKRLELQALNDLFNVFEETGNLGPAQQALNLINERLGDEISGARINAYISQGLLYVNKGQYGRAAFQFDTALAAAAGSDNRAGMRGLHLNIVHANLELGNLDKAARHMDAAWSYANPDGSVQFALLYYQAKLHLKRHEYSAASERMQEALVDPDLPAVWEWEMLYWLGRAQSFEGNRTAAIASYRRSINALESLRSNLGYSELKSHLLARKRQPYEALFEELIDSGRIGDAFAVAESAKSRSFIDTFIDHGAASDSPESGFDVESVAKRLDSVIDYVGMLRTSPVVEPADYADLIDVVSGVNLFSYFVVGDRLFLITINRRQPQVRAIGASADSIRETILEYREARSDPQLLARLGSVLLPEDLLPEPGSHLFIAPDDVLGDIAFAGLRTGEEWVAESYSLSLVPSASALHALMTRDSRPQSSGAAIVAGDPDGDLPAGRREAEDVAGLLGVVPLLGRDATFKRVSAAQYPEVFHIATHSGISQLGPWLQLAEGGIPGLALLQEEFRPELAVLASCASGAGSGKHLWGSLGGLFLSGGTPSVVVTHWSVDDSATRALIGDFYRAHLQGLGPSQALAVAQRTAIQRGVDVANWAAFVVIGDARAATRLHN